MVKVLEDMYFTNEEGSEVPFTGMTELLTGQNICLGQYEVGCLLSSKLFKNMVYTETERYATITLKGNNDIELVYLEDNGTLSSINDLNVISVSAITKEQRALLDESNILAKTFWQYWG